MPKIEIDLADLGLPTGRDFDGEPTGSSTLQDLIVRAAVDRLLSDTDHQVRADLREKVNNQYNKEIQERVKALVEEAFTAPIQRTTRWGEKQGEPTTVREIIREGIEKFLTAPSRGSNRYQSDPYSNLTELVEDQIKHVMSTDLKKTVEAAKGAVHEKVTDAALRAAVEVLSK
ncbi:hypothetical protein PP641_gp077 [Arthrobacter phage SilentRX]|uniref:Uncharacterized protein n=1 Tax=Arthrobacter phage SilentRX TaxID=2836091 RepID=A0A8F3E8Q1_9CAUD|nr:hypothetical protein PP641_gp077 [Arthrobacter phage SilentRX]QWY82817.1 hypothetical protein SEA_SILENTRX_77 [Arthrobacter phage SilentRX]